MIHVDLDWRRVHLTGFMLRAQYRQVVQAATVHVYLTIPFVLSWPMMEAMNMGAAIVASNFEPVREIAANDIYGRKNALLEGLFA